MEISPNVTLRPNANIAKRYFWTYSKYCACIYIHLAADCSIYCYSLLACNCMCLSALTYFRCGRHTQTIITFWLKILQNECPYCSKSKCFNRSFTTEDNGILFSGNDLKVMKYETLEEKCPSRGFCLFEGNHGWSPPEPQADAS